MQPRQEKKKAASKRWPEPLSAFNLSATTGAIDRKSLVPIQEKRRGVSDRPLVTNMAPAPVETPYKRYAIYFP
jgi:hypothetical protein